MHKERNVPDFADFQHETGAGTALWAQNSISDDEVFNDSITTASDRQTQWEKPGKDTDQNTNTPCDLYFFSPIKATEDLERNEEKGQVEPQEQNSCTVRSDEVGQEEQEWI